MKKLISLISLCLTSGLWPLTSGFAQTPQLINFQGRLLSETNLVNGNVGLSLRLFDASASGTKLYEDSNSVAVVDGLYSTFIGDNPTNNAFLTALTNAQVWVEVAVNGTTLAPRERVAAVPFALATRGLLVDVNTNLIVFPNAMNVVSSQTSYAAIHAGRRNSISTNSNQAVIGGGELNEIGPNAKNSTIANGNGNTIEAGAEYSSIGGGVVNGIGAGAFRAVIAGGAGNVLGTNASESAIGGGVFNVVATGSRYATIAGGYTNRISTNSLYSAIGGGRFNEIDAGTTYGTIAGGRANRLSPGAHFGTVPGGHLNEATNYAFAAGRRAKALHTGAFVWGDATDADVASTADNEATFRVSGGFRVLNGELLANQGVRVGDSGTAFARVQAGSATLGPGTNTMVYSVAFPSAFAAVPKVQITPRNDTAFDVPDTFAATVRKVTPTNFVVNIHRVDSAGGWAQQLRLEWSAWE